MINAYDSEIESIRKSAQETLDAIESMTPEQEADFEAWLRD